MEMFEGYNEANKCWLKKTESIKKRMDESRYKKEGGLTNCTGMKFKLVNIQDLGRQNNLKNS